MSKKLDQSLIDAYKAVYEEKRGHAAGSSDAEKQASQLASDVRYKAKGKVPQGATDEEKMKIFLQILGSSPAPSVVKSMAKEKLLGKKKTVKEDAKMGRMSDDDLGKAHKKFSDMDQSTPSNKFMLKRIEKEQKKRKKMTEDTKAMKKYLDDKAEKLKKKKKKQSDAANNNPHFDSTQPSPSGKSMNEMMTAKKPKTKMNPKNMTKPANQPYTGPDYRVLKASYEMSPVELAIAKKRGRVKEGFSSWRTDLNFNEQLKK